MFFGFLSGAEMIFILFAIVILFGATRIPQLGDALGKGIHNFRNAVNAKNDDKDNHSLPPAQPGNGPNQPPTPKS